jgi:DNA-binding LacI/PurR family transcriptional regulator
MTESEIAQELKVDQSTVSRVGRTQHLVSRLIQWVVLHTIVDMIYPA